VSVNGKEPRCGGGNGICEESGELKEGTCQNLQRIILSHRPTARGRDGFEDIRAELRVVEVEGAC
jgi:hypothetical protein